MGLDSPNDILDEQAVVAGGNSPGETRWNPKWFGGSVSGSLEPGFSALDSYLT